MAEIREYEVEVKFTRNGTAGSLIRRTWAYSLKEAVEQVSYTNSRELTNATTLDFTYVGPPREQVEVAARLVMQEVDVMMRRVVDALKKEKT